MDAKALREQVKRIPVLGPAVFKAYLRAFHKEGEVLTIEAGVLEGMKFKRYMRTYFDGFVTGEFEQDVMASILREVRTGATFYDIGANNGLIAMAASKAVGKGGRVIACEPHPETANELREQLRINGLEWVEVVELAISDENGEAEFADEGASDMLGLMELEGQNASQVITVQTATLDSVIKTRGVPDVIKIDVEGADMLVLAGAAGLLADPGVVIFMELHTPEIGVEYQELMDALGYSHFELDGTPITGPIESRHVISRPPARGNAS